ANQLTQHRGAVVHGLLHELLGLDGRVAAGHLGVGVGLGLGGVGVGVGFLADARRVLVDLTEAPLAVDARLAQRALCLGVGVVRRLGGVLVGLFDGAGGRFLGAPARRVGGFARGLQHAGCFL